MKILGNQVAVRIQFGGAGLAIAMIASPVAAFESAASSPELRASNATAETAKLPSGDSEAFRDRKMEWSAEQQFRSTIVEGQSQQSPAEPLAISSPFGWRTDPLRGGGRHHAGVDLPGRTGTNVYATGAGRVVTAGWASGYGNLVEIEHAGGIRTRYGHLSRILINDGDGVARGQLIGKVGSTGRSTGPHLHYEVRVRGTAVDPLKYMGQAIPNYTVGWAPNATAEPKWAGWVGLETNRLPQSVIE